MRALVLATVFVMTLSAAARAQTPAQPLTVGWQDGFIIQSAGGDYRLQVGTLVQVDGRFTTDDPPPVVDTFAMRKARVIVGARLARYFDVRLMPDFGSGTATLADAYLDTRFSTAFRIRAGKDKTPIGYEILVGDANVFFPERSLASSLVPLRDVGFQAQGDLAGNHVSYAAGVFNGIPDGSTSTADVDANSGKDFAGRIVVRTSSGFGVHVGGSTGTQHGPLPSFRTSIGQSWFAYASDAVANGRRDRVTPALFYFHGPVAAFAEYVRSAQPVERGGVSRDVANQAWDVTGAYVLTGEAGSDRGVRPRAPFEPPAHHWGAVQVLARYAELDVDHAAFNAHFAAARASRVARQASVGLNWYPTSFVKWYASVERTAFEDSADARRPAEHAVIIRAQVAF